jgi:hypothetical protein
MAFVPGLSLYQSLLVITLHNLQNDHGNVMSNQAYFLNLYVHLCAFVFQQEIRKAAIVA